MSDFQLIFTQSPADTLTYSFKIVSLNLSDLLRPNFLKFIAITIFLVYYGYEKLSEIYKGDFFTSSRIINDVLDILSFWYGIHTIIYCISIQFGAYKKIWNFKNSSINNSSNQTDLLLNLENLIKFEKSNNYSTYNEDLNILIDDYYFMVYHFNIFTVFSFSRLLKLSIIYRPMEVIVRSLYAVCFDFLKFFPFFILVFMSFALFGLNVFGSFMENYKTLDQSILTLIEIALGELFYEKYYTFDSYIGTGYFIIYVIVIFLVGFNILSAIVNESFETVKKFLKSDSQRLHITPDSEFIQRNFNLIINSKLKNYNHDMRLVLTGKFLNKVIKKKLNVSGV